jgi:hypothetical protein
MKLGETPSMSSDLLFSSNSVRNFGGCDVPLFTDPTGYQGAFEIQFGMQIADVVKIS